MVVKDKIANHSATLQLFLEVEEDPFPLKLLRGAGTRGRSLESRRSLTENSSFMIRALKKAGEMQKTSLGSYPWPTTLWPLMKAVGYLH